MFLTIAQVSLKVLTFHDTAALFGLRENRSPTPAASVDAGGPAPAAATRCAWAVGVAAARVPSDAKCMARALAGSAMLSRRRMATTLHLGVAKDLRGADGLRAHAWLRCGDAVVIGASGSEHFTPVAAFDVRSARTPVEPIARRLPIERRRRASRHGLALQRELVVTLEALARAGISEAVVLKGVPLALRVFGSVAEREMRDIDLLVHRRDAPRAFAALTALGFESYRGLALDLKRNHALTLVRASSNGQVIVDLHWTAFHTGFGVAEGIQWHHTQRFAHQGLDCLVFDPAMSILHLAHHYLAHLSPKALRDFGAAWNTWHEDVDASDLLALARSTGQLGALAVAFSRAAEFGLLDAAAPRVRSLRGAVFLRLLRGRLGRSEHGRVILGPVAMRPMEGVRWALYALFPRPAAMRVIYGDGTPAQVAGRYVTRPFELAAKTARAVRQRAPT